MLLLYYNDLNGKPKYFYFYYLDLYHLLDVYLIEKEITEEETTSTLKTATRETTSDKPISSEPIEGDEKSSTKSESNELSDMSTLISDASPASTAHSLSVVRFLYQIKILLKFNIE